MFQLVFRTSILGYVCNSMRLRMTDKRERRLDDLKEATGESTKSKAIDTAIEFYIRMAGDTTAVPTGQFAELMQLADDQGSVTAAEIADVLDSDPLGVNYESNWSVEN